MGWLRGEFGNKHGILERYDKNDFAIRSSICCERTSRARGNKLRKKIVYREARKENVAQGK